MKQWQVLKLFWADYPGNIWLSDGLDVRQEGTYTKTWWFHDGLSQPETSSALNTLWTVADRKICVCAPATEKWIEDNIENIQTQHLTRPFQSTIWTVWCRVCPGTYICCLTKRSQLLWLLLLLIFDLYHTSEHFDCSKQEISGIYTY